MCGGRHLSSTETFQIQNDMMLTQDLQGAVEGWEVEGTSAPQCFCLASCWQLSTGDALKLFSGTFPQEILRWLLDALLQPPVSFLINNAQKEEESWGSLKKSCAVLHLDLKLPL